MTRRTRYHIASNPPPNLPGLVNELARHFKKEGGVVANRSSLKALFDRAHPDYKRAGATDEAMRCLLNCHILTENGGGTYMNKALAKAIAKAVTSGEALPDFELPADKGAYVRRLRQSFRKVRQKQRFPAAPATPTLDSNTIPTPELPSLPQAAVEENNEMKILTTDQLNDLSTDDLRGQLDSMRTMFLELEKGIDAAQSILGNRESAAQKLEEELAAIDKQRAELKAKIKALK